MTTIELVKRVKGIPAWAELARSDYGDVAFPCFDEAKRAGKNPNAVAKDSASDIETGGIIKKSEAVGGYVNMYLDFEKLLGGVFKDTDKNVKTRFSAGRVLLEHTSVNPNKALHIGHIRNTYLGEFIRRAIDKSSGYVLTADFIEDTGSQVADIMVAFEHFKKPFDTDLKFDLYCSKLYKEINEEYERDENLKRLKADVLHRIESNDAATTKLLDEIVSRVLKCQMDTILKQHIKYDILNLESYILTSGLIDEAMDLLKKKGLTYVSHEEKNNGCLVIKLDGKERILKRADGTYVYVAKDIAYALWKHGIIKREIKWVKFGENYDGTEMLISDSKGKPKGLGSFPSSITIVDSEQNAEQLIVKKTLEAFDSSIDYVHYSYEPVMISKKTAETIGLETESRFARMSGRHGITIEVDTLLNSIKERLVKTAIDNNRTLPDDVAFKISSNVLRYSLLKVSPSKAVIFDIDEATSLKGDTAVYINYTYARAMSILKKLERYGPNGDPLDDGEMSLLRMALFSRDKVIEAINGLKPSVLAEYLHEICDEFNSFYETHRVIGSENAEKRGLIVRIFADSLREIMDLLGLFTADVF